SAVLLLQPGIGKELRHVGAGRLGHRLGADPGGQFPGNGIAPLVQAVGKAAFHAFAVHDPVLLVHADGVHAAAGGTYRPGDETFDRLCRLVGLVHAACSSVRPRWRRSVSTEGSRHGMALNICMGSRLPHGARMLSRYERPVSAWKVPSSSIREKASADSTSAHL